MSLGGESSRPVRKSRGCKQKNIDNVTRKFLSNFDPETSEREKRKLNRRLYPHNNKHKTLYDENGILISTGIDLCDCLQDCPGCHFPCPKCSSKKCGVDCRNNRKWTVESMVIEEDRKEYKKLDTSTNQFNKEAVKDTPTRTNPYLIHIKQSLQCNQ